MQTENEQPQNPVPQPSTDAIPMPHFPAGDDIIKGGVPKFVNPPPPPPSSPSTEKE